MSTLLFLFAASAHAPPVLDDQLLAGAERAFAEGVESRGDSEKARAAFARSASGYDELWRRSHRNPELALNRANAHRLAGNLPAAILALHDGLAVSRWNRPLQVALGDARGAVAYPVTGDMAAQCKPTTRATIGTRVSALDAWAIGGVLWLVACAGVARFAMTRAPSWLAVAGGAVVALGVLGVLWLRDSRHQERESEHPLVVVNTESLLRKGNGEAFPARIEPRLPRGVEARKLTERGGWVQVRLAGGVVGWLPASAVLTSRVPAARVGSEP